MGRSADETILAMALARKAIAFPIEGEEVGRLIIRAIEIRARTREASLRGEMADYYIGFYAKYHFLSEYSATFKRAFVNLNFATPTGDGNAKVDSDSPTQSRQSSERALSPQARVASKGGRRERPASAVRPKIAPLGTPALIQRAAAARRGKAASEPERSLLRFKRPRRRERAPSRLEAKSVLAKIFFSRIRPRRRLAPREPKGASVGLPPGAPPPRA
jgi:hypothetical protein